MHSLPHLPARLLRRDLATAARVGRILPDAEELEFVPLLRHLPRNRRSVSNQPGTRLSFTDAAIELSVGGCRLQATAEGLSTSSRRSFLDSRPSVRAWAGRR